MTSPPRPWQSWQCVPGVVMCIAAALIPLLQAGAIPATARARSDPGGALTAPRRATSVTPSCLGSWRIVPSPHMAVRSILSGVAVASPHQVWAVGALGDPNLEHTLVERWDGARWRVLPTPETGADSHLFGVATITADDAWAVGDHQEQALVEHWDGLRWRVVASPSPEGYPSALRGVVALSRHDVWAVGDTASGTLVEHWDGTRWRVVASPSPGGPTASNALLAVASVSARDVWAVGWTTGEYREPLAEHWDGQRWRAVSAPVPGPPTALSLLAAVAVVAPDDAWAVGSYKYSAGGGTVIEHWDGVHWRVVPGPNLLPDSVLSGIAAVSARDIWAVGGAVIEHWDGTAWRVVPGPDGGDAGALAVGPAGDVWAVGPHTPGGTAIIEHYRDAPCIAPVLVVETIPTAQRLPRSLAVDTRTHRVFVGNGDNLGMGTVNVLDSARHSVLRTVAVPGGAMTVDERGGRVFVAQTGLATRRLSMLDATSGALLRTVALDAHPIAVAVDAATERAFVLGQRGTTESVTVLDATTGTPLRRVSLGPSPAQPTILVATRAGHIFVQDMRGVHMLDGRTGVVLQSSATRGTMALDARTERVVVVGGDGRAHLTVTVLDPTTGRVLRVVRVANGAPTGIGTIQELAIDEPAHRLVVAWQDSYDRCGTSRIDTVSGAILSTTDLGYVPVAVALDDARGRVFIAHQTLWNITDETPRGPGAVTVQDVTSGTVLATITVGWLPTALMLDERAQRLFVLNEEANGVGGDALGSVSALNITRL